MAKLGSGRRNALPASSFGLPGSRKYPMPDKAHAANAKARATQQVSKGNLSPASAAKIDAKANAVLGKSKGSAPVAKKPLPAALKAHQFKKGASSPSGSLGKGKPAAAPKTAKVAGAPSYHDHVVKMFKGGSNPGRC
jgi:hypothetical protein